MAQKSSHRRRDRGRRTRIKKITCEQHTYGWQCDLIATSPSGETLRTVGAGRTHTRAAADAAHRLRYVQRRRSLWRTK